jgi:hypothetical protein
VFLHGARLRKQWDDGAIVTVRLVRVVARHSSLEERPSELVYCQACVIKFLPTFEVSQMVEERNAEPQMDVAALYREETFTDRKVGVIRRLTPVLGDGSDDPARAVVYVGQAELMTNMGPAPISFEIEGKSLAEAVANFASAASAAVERTVQQIQEMRRQAASQLVVPQGGIPNLGPGGPGRGGKIQMP